MRKYLGTLSFITAVTSANASPADELKDYVLTELNAVLQTGEHSLSYGSSKTVNIDSGNLTFSYNTVDRQGCRSFEADFDSSNGSTNLDFCGSVEHESYGLTYSLIDNDRIYLKPGLGISVFNDLSTSVSLDITHPLLAYTGEYSHSAGESYYDAYVSLAFGGSIPVSNTVDIYADIEGLYGMFTHSWNSELGIQSIQGPTALNVGVGIQDFGVHEESPTSQVIDTILGGKQEYISAGIEYCPIENTCFRGNMIFPESGQEHIDVRVNLNF